MANLLANFNNNLRNSDVHSHEGFSESTNAMGENETGQGLAFDE